MGVERASGLHGEVGIERCRACGRYWLTVLIEQEAFARSGRWYRGLIGEAQARSMTPDAAVPSLARLPWHFAGGSRYGTTGRRRDGPLEPRSL